MWKQQVVLLDMWSSCRIFTFHKKYLLRILITSKTQPKKRIKTLLLIFENVCENVMVLTYTNKIINLWCTARYVYSGLHRLCFWMVNGKVLNRIWKKKSMLSDFQNSFAIFAATKYPYTGWKNHTQGFPENISTISIFFTPPPLPSETSVFSLFKIYTTFLTVEDFLNAFLSLRLEEKIDFVNKLVQRKTCYQLKITGI